MSIDMNAHIALIKLIIAYSLLGGFVFTVVVTCLSMIGIVKFSDPSQQSKLFGVLVVEIVVIGLGVFADLLNFSPKAAQNAVEASFLKVSPASPVISNIDISNSKVGGKEIVYQKIHFSDPEGDATNIQYLILGTNTKDGYQATSGNITEPMDTQIKGATLTAQWRCGPGKHWFRFAAIIFDKKENSSRPYIYTIHCGT